MRPVKLWAQAANLKEPTYGITWKMMKVEVEPPASSGNNLSSFYNNDAFVDSDEEEIEAGTNVNVNADSEEEEESSESESEDDSPPVKAK